MNVRPAMHETALEQHPAPHAEAPRGRPFVAVVGAGPSGVRVAQELSQRGCGVVIFNAEKRATQNRIQLTPLLAGDAQIGVVAQDPVFSGPGDVKIYTETSVIDIDRKAHTVTSRYGRKWTYDKLVLCTGSRPHIPNIPGIRLSGVFRFRNFDDVEQLLARSFSAREVVVIGGGLLGLEAARAMARRGATTTIVEHEAHLMARQLDKAGGARLAAEIKKLGLVVLAGKSVSSVDGTYRVETITLSDGSKLNCDTVIVCTGIRANIEMARDVGLSVGRGITVSGTLQTSDPDIYAVGECAEFDGHIYGLVGPGFEQAAVAASHIVGGQRTYAGSVPSTKLKLLGVDVFSMGDVEQVDLRTDVKTIAFESGETGHYRRLILKNGRLVGAIAVGPWPEISLIQQRIRSHAPLPVWQRMRFRRSGLVWGKTDAGSVTDWPAEATVCNCTGVTRGQLTDALTLGCASANQLALATSASTVCGSCRPLLHELLGGPAVREPVAASSTIKTISLIAAVLALAIWLLPPVPYSTRIANVGLPELLWLSSLPKQISGYTLLALFSLAAILSLRKRLRFLSFGDYSAWRIIHLCIGALALLAFVGHTGMRLGANLNGVLAWTFMGLALAGGTAGLTIAYEHRIGSNAMVAKRLRNANFWLHLLLSWPIPALLVFHVLLFYYY